MTYQVLARKWRPKKFADLVGQEHVVKALVNALGKGRLHHAYLLTGTRGVGKTTIARILAKSLNCRYVQNGEPCNECDSCNQIDAGRYVDVLEIDAASNTGIDNIREVLENAQYAPTLGSYKVYIIDEVHMLSKSAFNAMLKTLEEPPEHVKFILATTDPQKVPITVLSRCLQFVLRNLNSTQVHDHLVYVLQQEQIAYEDSALQLLGRAAAGSMRDALSLLDQAIAIGSGNVTEIDVRNMIGAVDKSYLYALLEALSVRDGQALLDKAGEMASCAIGFDSALTELALLFQRLSLIQNVQTAISTDDPEYAALVRLSGMFSAEQIQLYYQCALRGKADLPLAPDENAGFIMTLLRMLAFAPLAALSNQRLHGQIANTQLSDATNESVPPTVPREMGENALQAPVSLSIETENKEVISQSEPVQSSVKKNPVIPDTASASIPTMEIASVEDNADSGSAELVTVQPSSGENGIEKQIESTIIDIEAIPQGNLIEDFPNSDDIDESDFERGQVDQITSEQSIIPESFPPLNADNWPEILRILAHKLGAVQLFSQHTAIVDYDENSGDLTIALTEQGEPTANRELLIRLADNLSLAYGKPIQVYTCGWQEQTSLETPKMRQQRLLAEAKQQAQNILEAQPIVQNLINTFNATWVPESLQLNK